MKPIAMTAVLLMAAGLQLTGQAINYNSSKSNTGNVAAHPLTCTGPDGKGPCMAAHVTDMNNWLASVGRKQNKPLAEVKAVKLASPKDGVLTCEQNSGAACTPEQQMALAQFYKPTAAARTKGAPPMLKQ
jgi:hypothetical protein